jgi:triosephosphate isomerase
MSKLSIFTPFFVFNPKSYLYGEDLLKLAKVADNLAKEKDISIFVTTPFADLAMISDNTENIIVTAQHMDGIKPGRGMGHVLPDSLHAQGVQATFLNHAERPMNLNELIKAIERANELDIITIVCADSLSEAEVIARLNPDILLCEPTELIGTGKTSDDEYIEETNKAIKNINPKILVMQAAGISTAEDVFRTISLNADGTGCTSGIVKANNPKNMLIDMIEAAIKADK